MSPAITLSGAGLRCEIKPELGGCIAGLWLDDVPVLRSTAAAELATVRLAGSYPLVQNNGPEPHAIHGIGWQRPWQVLDQGDDLLLLACEHRADAAWPFAFDASQTFCIRRDVLELTLSMTNQSAVPAPAGLGWHPYFVKRAGSHIAFDATGRWEMSGEKLPTHCQPSAGLATDCASLDVDHCFDGWNGSVTLRDELLHTRINASLSRLVVFTNTTRGFVAIEPVSHVNNAVNLLQADAARAEDLGLEVLAPGESMSAQMSIQVERAP
ncbi:MAG: aldose 1-epimerase [Polaromonas sp.]|uniref:aldose epimerase family protein n=1 Tax=Polaromonas sp. TaxID=1869339 RepID=UPI0027360FFA|nr:aldose 1-epimerase [Polaromonas sp.]MDP2817316.1 aldose 1-epimerase [Polaromonas sp.]